MVGFLFVIGFSIALGALLTTLVTNRHGHAAPADDPWDDLYVELERARRYDHSFQLARLSPATSSGPQGPPQIGVRRTDRAWRRGNDLYVLLPESDGTAGDGWVLRLQQQGVGESVVVRIACFPQDGLTLGALLDHLADPAAQRQPGPNATAAFEHRTQVAS